MAFVKELIDTEEKRAFYDSLKLHDCIGKVLESNDWYVDRENNHYIVGMGGGSFEIPLMYGIVVPHGLIVLQSDTDYRKRLDRICYQNTVELTPEEIKSLVFNVIIYLNSNEGYTAFKNTEKEQLPNPVLMDTFEEKHYGI
jgi:hypothetical protein